MRFRNIFLLVLICSVSSACDPFRSIGYSHIAALGAHLDGNYEEAIESYNLAFKERQFSAEYKATLYLGRGNAYFSLGKHNLALADYQNAIFLLPKKANGYIERGVTFYYMGRFEEAVKELDKAAQIEPGSRAVSWLYLVAERQRQDGKEVFKVGEGV